MVYDREVLSPYMGGFFDDAVSVVKDVVKSPVTGVALSALAVVAPPVGVPALAAQQVAARVVKTAEGVKLPGKPAPTPAAVSAAKRLIVTTGKLAPHSPRAFAGFQMLKSVSAKFKALGTKPLSFAGTSPAKALNAANRVVAAAKAGDKRAKAAIVKTIRAKAVDPGAAAAAAAMASAARLQKKRAVLKKKVKLPAPKKGKGTRGILVTDTGKLQRGAFQSA